MKKIATMWTYKVGINAITANFCVYEKVDCDKRKIQLKIVKSEMLFYLEFGFVSQGVRTFP